MIETNVLILGAGPGGVAAALQLDNLGVKSFLVDKAVFPRDKICGDAISGKAVHWLDKIDKNIIGGFRQAHDLKVNCWGVEFTFPKNKNLKISMYLNGDKENLELTDDKAEGFVSKRIDFDNYLVDFVKKAENVDFREGISIDVIEKVSDGFVLKNKKGIFECKAKVVIVADGAQSKFARKFGNIKKEPKHYAGGIRQYYKNVDGFGKLNLIELHYIKAFLPGYLWIFPLPNGGANVGVCMSSDNLSKHKVNLKTEMLQILKEHPRFKERFKEAIPEGKVFGFGLPLGSKKRKISGDNYLLIGDAASLIDPLTGEGIANAIISGYKAAQNVAESLKTNTFTSTFYKTYDNDIYRILGKEFKISYLIQRSLQYPWAINIVGSILTRNKQLINVMAAMFVHVDLRKKLRDPRFYFKLIFNK